MLVSSMNNQVTSNQNRTMTLSRRRLRPCGLRPHPRHQLQIQYMQISVKVLPVPTSKNKHLIPSYQCRSMPKSSSRSSSPVWTLIPGHLDWIQCVEISKNSTLSLSFTSEDENTGAGKHCSVPITGLWGCSFYFWLDPSRCI